MGPLIESDHGMSLSYLILIIDLDIDVNLLIELEVAKSSIVSPYNIKTTRRVPSDPPCAKRFRCTHTRHETSSRLGCVRVGHVVFVLVLGMFCNILKQCVRYFRIRSW